MRRVQAGDLGAALRDLDLAEQRAREVPARASQDYVRLMVDFEQGTGRYRAAETWVRRISDADERYRDLAELAWARGDKRALCILATSVSGPPTWWAAYHLALCGHIREAERLVQRPKAPIEERLQGLVRGEIALQKEDYNAAARQCEETLSLTLPKTRGASSGFYAADCAATAWEKCGDLAQAASILDQVAEPHFANRIHWFMLAARRMRLYRQLGRNAEADRVARRLEQLLAVADPDHPVRALLAADRKPASDQAVSASVAPTAH